MNAADTIDRPLSARQVLGAKVTDLGLVKLGHVEDLAIDPQTGRVTYAILGYGGLLGVGEKLFPVPFRSLFWRPEDGTFTLQHHGLSREDLRHAPYVLASEMDTAALRGVIPQVHSFYHGLVD